jgi:two-component system, NtrC family, sensor kinase
MGRRAKPSKGKAEAKRPLARKSPKDEATKVPDLEKRLAEALKDKAEAREQQAAATEILRVISSSPSEVQPVFETIVANAVRLCRAHIGAVFQFDGTLIHIAAMDYESAEHFEAFRQSYPIRLDTPSLVARAIGGQRIVHIPDVDAASDMPMFSRDWARRFGYRSLLIVPMLRDGLSVGAIGVNRILAEAFSDSEIDLLRTFADQAVIAIENVRLFKELEARNSALTESLEQQTATADILEVISRSPTDVEPVFEAVVASAARLCEAQDVAMLLVDGDDVRLAARLGAFYMSIPADFRIRLTRGSAATRAVVDRTTVHIHDFAAESEEEYPVGRELARRFGHRSMLAVPLLREGVPIGVICAVRLEVRPFPDQQIALLRTFADQAVIAIENVRLFTELQASNRELTTALDTQTATSDILRVISRSQTNVQPVFDTIVANAVRLCRAHIGAVFQFDGELLHLVAHHNFTPEMQAALGRLHPRPPQRDMVSGRAILSRAVVQIEDILADREYHRSLALATGWRSMIAVPMLREGEPIGTIVINRREPGPFTEQQIALLETFADQAVIAIGNLRLLSELQARTAELTRSVDELTALGEVGRALSSTLDLETVLQTIVLRANALAGTAGCTIWEYDAAREEFRLRASHYADESDTAVLQAPSRATTIPKGQGLTTEVMEHQQPVQIHDITTVGAYESPLRGPLIEAGHRALLGVPLLSEDEVIGVLAVTRKAAGEFEPEIVRLLSTFATQSALAIQNARLFVEIERKSRQLEAASHHKSEFLANMSHELRTPLNAIIGFSEVLTERMFGDLNEKQDEYLRDIYASGQHLLSLINDILDLSKIEAGRMDLEPEDFDLAGAIDNALTLVRERAGRRGIMLGRAIDGRVGTISADERKVKQVLLNLLSNAIKFTPEGGRIDVRAAVSDGMAEVSVADTGVGIAPEDQEAVFEEFRQVGTADKKVEGTGLGLALSRKFVELHGGRIWVNSELGHGSTFTFTLPVRSGG